MEFKGTKGKWEHKIVAQCSNRGVLVFRVFSDIQNSSIDKGICRIEVENNLLEQQANALLISKAPEMLEMLQSLVSSEMTPLAIRKQAKQLIKEATEIS